MNQEDNRCPGCEEPFDAFDRVEIDDDARHWHERCHQTAINVIKGEAHPPNARVLAVLYLHDGLQYYETRPEVTDSAEAVKSFASTLRDMARFMVDGWKRGKAAEKARKADSLA